MGNPRAGGVFRTKVQERFCFETRPDPCGLVIFGASGDLAERKILPSLFRLRVRGQLPRRFYALGAGRTEFTDDVFRERARTAITSAVKDASPESLKEFLSALYYQPLRYDQPEDYRALADRLVSLDQAHQTGGNHAFNLSIPPGLYECVIRELGRAGLAQERENGHGWSRVIIEKPFGRDLETAQALAKETRRVFSEDQTYRIDHYLGKETVQNILVLRFANIFFEPIWNRNYVDHVQITVAESIGIGHRAGYYEEAGCLRDMFQNHLLQLLCVTAMEAPSSFHANRVRDEASKVLRAIRPIPIDRVDERAVRGQYGPGRVEEEAVLGYRQESGVSPDSRTETFVAMKVVLDNWRWQGVPFYLRSGKRLAARRSEVVIRFKHVPHSLFQPLQPTDLTANTLVLRIQPEEGVSLSFETKHPGPKMCMSSVEMDFDYEQSFGEPPEAYERLFLDAMSGDQTLFIRSDWINMAWSFLTPVLTRWAADGSPAPYPAGLWGPASADELLARDGRTWLNG
ncbi:MAG: glucose-6-phosphate dehydrogenase [Elusimicrobia bacterium]|nr:glucose-6-phosphate dehydrogenase [Elusimicrobiota bacterium]